MLQRPGVRGVLIDLDGVLYDADRLIAGAADTVRWLQTHGIPHLFVTNRTSKSRAALAEKRGAQKAGLQGALVKTEKFRPTDLAGRIRPNVIFDSIADLPGWWTENA
jgi:ribonucleotide monophosphatase NagD (HAD superfamily)